MTERDFIVVVGNQGMGKSVWSKIYAATLPRLLVYDPKASYANVDFNSDPAEWIEGVCRKTSPTFRYGTAFSSELEMFGDAAYAAGDCTYVIEECALIFNRGELLQDWAKPLVFMGREAKINLILIAQRASKIPVDLRSQCTRFVTFRQTEPADVKALVDRFGDVAEDIDTFPALECLDWNDGATSRYAISPA